MHDTATAWKKGDFVGLTLSLMIPSLGAVYKYTGSEGVIFYIVIVPLVLWIEKTHIVEWFGFKVSAKAALWLVATTFLGLLAVFLVIYPIADSGVVGGGSDADDALDIATQELLKGRYPFYSKTYLGNPVGPFPGALLLAIPFVLLGTSAYQNLFWLGVFFIAARVVLKSVQSALLLLWTILALSPVVMSNVVTGTDDLSNAIYVLVFILVLVLSVATTKSYLWKKLAAAVLLGTGLSSRSNFILLLPLIFCALVQGAGWRVATIYVAISCLAFGLCTIPFWLYDPHGFSPIYTQYDKVSQFHTVLPFSGLLIPLVSGMLAIALGYRYTSSDVRRLLKDSGFVLAVPVACTAAFSVLEIGASGLIWTGYGVFFLPFSTLAFWATEFSSVRTE